MQNHRRVKSQRQLLTTALHAARVLKAFGVARRELGVSQIAEAVNLTTSQAYRLIASLEAEGLVEQNPETGKYRLSVNMMILGHSVLTHTELGKAALPIMERLAASTGQTVSLAVLHGYRVVHIQRIESLRLLRMGFPVGRQLPAYCTATGKAMLAHLDEETLVAYLQSESFARLTTDTITSAEALRADLREVRRRGYSIDNGEFEAAIRGVGVPIRDSSGAVTAATAVFGPAFDIPVERIPDLAEAAKVAAMAISQRLGYQPLAVTANPLASN